VAPAAQEEQEQLALRLAGTRMGEVRAPRARHLETGATNGGAAGAADAAREACAQADSVSRQASGERDPKRPRLAEGSNGDAAPCAEANEAQDGEGVEVIAVRHAPARPPGCPGPTLRISAGRAAAAAGIHTYADIGELFLEFVYQDQPELLIRDAALAGVEVVSPAAERVRLLAKSGEAESLEKALKSAATSEGVEGARAAQDAVRMLVQVAEKSGRLTVEEAFELKETLEKEICLEFGARHEDAALDAYAVKMGRPVYGQQKRISVALPQVSPAEALSAVFPPPGSFGPELAAGAAASSAGSLGDQREAFFRLTGFVDGIVDLPRTAAAADAARLAAEGPQALRGTGTGGLETYIVEVKHRMGKIRDPPNLYDLVQLGSYCRALGCTKGHLVQCLREHASQASVGQLHVYFMDFSEGSHDRRGWDQHVLPGLYSMASAVYAARADDDLRIQLLAATDAEARSELVRSLCPHLR